METPYVLDDGNAVYELVSLINKMRKKKRYNLICFTSFQLFPHPHFGAF